MPRSPSPLPFARLFLLAALVACGGTEGLPDAPTEVTATAGNGQVTVTWEAPASDGGHPITRYSLRGNSSNGGGGVSAGTGPARTSITMDLESGRTYTFTVTAVNEMGESEPSAPSNAVTAP